MRRFEDYHPLVQLLYFIAVSAPATFFLHPVLALISLFGAIALFLVRNGTKGGRSHLYSLLFFLALTVVNLLFRHNGATVLFVINHNPVTLEALIYGAVSGVMLLSVLYWFRSLSQIMTADRLLYLFGKLSPRLALIVSMALRYIPLFTRQAKRVHTVQRTLYLSREDSLIDKTRAAGKTMSVMTTWALENGMITADSMTARGYGVGRRTHYHQFRMRRGDVALLVVTLVLETGIVILAVRGSLAMSWYPYVSAPRGDAMALIGYGLYATLAGLPVGIEIGERIRWNYLHSKI